MRFFAYGVAVLAAIGIMVGINLMPEGDKNESPTPTSVKSPADVSVSTESHQLAINVPEMMCEFACFPKVKKTLEANEAVTLVKLAPQKEEGTLDNKQVIVSYESGFDPDAAVKLLEKVGFADSSVAEGRGLQ